MRDEIVTTATTTKGRLRVRNWNRVESELKNSRDGEWLVTISRAKATRSGQANRYYWGTVVQAVAEHTGYTPDEVHEIFKAKFIPKRLALADGNGEAQGEFVIGGTTTRLDTTEFYEYVEAIRQWAAETLSIDIPDPVEAA